MSVGSWVVAQTKPNRERWAAENVARQGFRWYLPMTLSALTAKRQLHPVCLFPRYLFVYTEGPWRSLQGTYGVTRVVMTGDNPAVVPEREIESLRAREDSEGLVRLPKPLDERLKPGMTIRVSEGLMSGYKGLVEGMQGPDRVRVLIDFLGRQASFLLNQEWVEEERIHG